MLFRTETPRQRIMQRLSELQKKRASWEPHWRELADNFLPRRLRLNQQGEYERGDKINSSLVDSMPMVAARILSAGLMASITSPARVWHRLTLRDPELKDYGPVKMYLAEVEARMRWVFSIGNFYQALSDGVYPDIGVFGTAAMIMDEHPRRVLNCYAMPMGEYWLASNGEGIIDTCYRDLPMTVRQVVTRFCSDGNLARLTQQTRNAYAKGNYEQVVRVLHVIEPNDDFRDGAIGPQGKAYKSLWLEREAKDERYLRTSGYGVFPVIAPRWSVTGYDVYGRSPGMNALADAKELQHEKKRRGRMVDKAADPPMKASPGMRGSRATLIPGEVTYISSEPNAMFEPAMKVEWAAMKEVRDGCNELRDAVQSHFYADLWMRVLSDDRAQRATATEIEEGRQELMLQLGPVLEHLNPELLKAAVDRAYDIASGLGVFDDLEPPEEIQGEDLEPEFISVLHQAQKAMALNPIRTLWGEAAKIAQLKPAVLDKLEADATIDEIADVVGAPPKLVLDAEGVAKVRKIRAEQEQQAAQAQEAAAMAQGVATLGKTPAPAPDNALGALLGGMSPIAEGALPPGGGAL